MWKLKGFFLFIFFQNEISLPSIIGADNFLLSLSLIQSRVDEWTWILLLPWLKAVAQHRDSGVLPEQHYNVNGT